MAKKRDWFWVTRSRADNFVDVWRYQTEPRKVDPHEEDDSGFRKCWGQTYRGGCGHSYEACYKTWLKITGIKVPTDRPIKVRLEVVE